MECLGMVCRVYVEKVKWVLPRRCPVCAWMGEKEGELFPDVKKSREVIELTTDSPNLFRLDQKLSVSQLVYIAAFWLTMGKINSKLQGKMSA